MVARWSGPGFVLSSRFAVTIYLLDSKSDYIIVGPKFTKIYMEKLTFDSWVRVLINIIFSRRDLNVLATWALVYLIYICGKISQLCCPMETDQRPWLPTNKCFHWDVGDLGLGPHFKYFTAYLSTRRVWKHQPSREGSSRIFEISACIAG